MLDKAIENKEIHIQAGHGNGLKYLYKYSAEEVLSCCNGSENYNGDHARYSVSLAYDYICVPNHNAWSAMN